MSRYSRRPRPIGRLLRRALVLCLLIAAVTACSPGAVSGDLTAESGEVSALKKVRFVFTPDQDYEHVFLAGTFNSWSTDATPMANTGDAWKMTLLLTEGEYQYKFVADGNWITDEEAEGFHPDGFGGENSVIKVGGSFEAMDIARGDGKIFTDGLQHKQDCWERSLNENGVVTMRARVWSEDVEGVVLNWAASPEGSTRAAGAGEIEMNLFDSDGTYEYYTVEIDVPAFEYFFILRDGEAAAVLDRAGVSAGATTSDAPFVFDAAEVASFRTPDWVKDAVIYQIFPERFANGDRGNDPDFSEWYYDGVRELPPSGTTNGEYFHLIDDWYDVAGLQKSPYKTDGKPDWNSFYGGDIAGILQNLDYLEDLGITCIYFNPLFTSKSNHKYDAATYQEIDPHFGTNEEFAAFVDACHSRGIRVVIDLAINHTGHTYWAFVNCRTEGDVSSYWNWYEFKKWPVPGGPRATPANAIDYYDCWWGFGQMPNLSFDLTLTGSDEQSAVEIEDADPNWPLVNHLLDTAERWLIEADIDGYRLDVSPEVPFWFWELFRERVKQVKPDAYIVGELWGSVPEWINGRYYDATMNYKYFREPVQKFIGKGEMTAEEFDIALAPGRLIYPDEGVRAMMNLIGSHDTERFLTYAGGDTRCLRLAMLFGMTYVGAPTIYYGDEVAMMGGGDPDCRRPFYWKWSGESNRVETHDFIRDLIAFRKEHPALSRGGFETLIADGRLFAYRRVTDDDEVIVVMNTGKKDAKVKVPIVVPAGAEGAIPTIDHVLERKTLVPALEDGQYTVEVKVWPLSGAILVPRWTPPE